MARNVYLVGSVPFANAQAVFETVSAALGPHLLTLPDGETGERLDWITWLEPVFAGNPAFEPSSETFQLHAGVAGRRRYGLKPGRSPRDVTFDNLFYADIARRSYASFAALKQAGKIPPPVKFQVDLVPAHSVIWLFVEDKLQRAVDPIYNDAVLREIDKIVAAIPSDQLAIQFDIASAVFARLERNQPGPYGATKEAMQETFSAIVVRLAERVPAAVDLLFHFCYGDAGHRHVVEPTDMADMVDYANRLSARLSAADHPNPHAGAARPFRRRLFQAAGEPETAAADPALPRPRALHRRRRRHPSAHRRGRKTYPRLRHRHRMRLRPPRPGHPSRAAADSRRGGRNFVAPLSG